ncbi:MAG: type II toxin-antitoxin system Phd/YefM family antitoxin [Candidatus Gracilibacteria bacterium]
MLRQQVISVTNLRTKTKESLQNLQRGPKYIFSNNSPVAVLLDVEEYEMLLRPDLIELSKENVDDEMLSLARQAQNTPLEELLDL